jgi:uncharacterized SAM-binding protein YcdF (DUF218 family)
LKLLPRHTWTRRALLLFALGLAALVVEWRAVLSYLGHYLVYSQPPRSADLILVLAGNFYGPRVFQGADLALHGYAPKLLISGSPYRGRYEGDFAIGFLAQRGIATNGFESFHHYANSTIEEAVALRPELARRGAKRVLLVTSSFHARRSAIVFRLFCPGIEFISVPSSDPEYRPDNWWMDSRSKSLFYSEWSKIAGTLLIAYPKYLVSNLFH